MKKYDEDEYYDDYYDDYEEEDRPSAAKAFFSGLVRFPFIPAMLIATIIMGISFNYISIAREIKTSVVAGLNEPLVTVVGSGNAEKPAAVAQTSEASSGKTDGKPSGVTSSGKKDTTDSGRTTAAEVKPTHPDTRGSSEYVYDPAMNTGDANADMIRASEAWPEVWHDSLDEFGNLLPGAAAPEGSFAYYPSADPMTQKPVIDTTAMLSYPPVPVDSQYFSDPGFSTFTTAKHFRDAEDNYFDDALFIGDSRTVGIFEYGGLSADFLCSVGYSTYSFQLGKNITLQSTGEEMPLQEALARKTYGKIYIMLGINDNGIGNASQFQTRYLNMIGAIEEAQPDAVIFLCANLYFGRSYENTNGVMNNVAVKDKNCAIAKCADGQRTIYLNYNGMFIDDEGFLRDSLTHDGAHLYGQYYGMWSDYFRHHAL